MFPELITELLEEGYQVSFSAPGHSMYPTIMANETIVVEPINPETVKPGDIILYRTNGRLVAHRVVGINMSTDNTSLPLLKASTQFNTFSQHKSFILRGDASATCDEPVKYDQILGKVISVERNGCRADPYGWGHKLGCLAHRWTMRIRGILN
jgi:signal peptidase I